MSTRNNESNLFLALQALENNPKLSVREAAITYQVLRTTLRGRRRGIQSRHEISANSRKLTNSEEDAIIRYIIDLDSRSFPPRLSSVKDMANRLLELRSNQCVGVNWATNFIRRQPQLKTRLSRRIDYQRVLYEDPNLYRVWFLLVRNTIDKYGI
jgi:hypothetical protein